MTHQSGIHADSYVTSKLADCKRHLFRAVKLVIKNECLVLEAKIPTESSWENDFEHVIKQLLEFDSPCYIFYRLDSDNSFGHDWVFISWVPESSNVRQKMLYASTKATVRKQFGDNLIKDDLTVNSFDDISLKAYKKHMESKTAPGPFSNAEIEIAGVRAGEVSTGLNPSYQTIGGVSFALSSDSRPVLRNFNSGAYDYVQLAIDIENEIIKVCEAHEHITPRALVKCCPEKEGRYHLYRFRYLHEGEEHTANFFRCGLETLNISKRISDSLLQTFINSCRHWIHSEDQVARKNFQQDTGSKPSKTLLLNDYAKENEDRRDTLCGNCRVTFRARSSSET
uniref:ADF-H domain-containing protein n=1 Tax=Trichobilharzia regenti TaxID=157069 RepID=A0AA85KEH0_TRIRE|nr:unnamed protein product [Trichobilharzia regenti]